jgi:hypothetical protein
VTIVGPPGLEGLIANMRPFVNRQYPAVTVREVGGVHASSSQQHVLELSSKYFHWKALPICASKVILESTVSFDTVWLYYGCLQSGGSAVGLSYIISPRRASERSNEESSSSIAVLAHEMAYPTYPSIEEIIASAPSLSTCVFVACGVSSLAAAAVSAAGVNPLSTLERLSRKFDTIPLFLSMEVS